MGESPVDVVAIQPAPEPAPQPAPVPPPQETLPSPETARLISLDAYRGFIMLAMVTGGLGLPQVAKSFPDSAVWQFLGYQFDHVAWTGCAFWDLIQPAFMFMVGVAMPYSHASRLKKGQKPLHIAGHTIWRCVLLVFLGIFLVSNWGRQTDWTFVNVLTQIGLGYGFVYLLIGRGLGLQLLAIALILGGYGYWFYSHPVPGLDFNFPQVGLLGPWPWDVNDPFAHWNKNTNAAAAFDVWFLNELPQPMRVSRTLFVQLGVLAPGSTGFLTALPYATLQPEIGHVFQFNSGGYQTLNFIPSMATMILGLIAGETLRRWDLLMREKFLRLLFLGIVCGMGGYILSLWVCPSVKRIWTPSWTLYSAGWTFAMLAGFFAVVDWWEFERWTFPLLVVGTNSIAMYCMANLLKPWVRDTFKRHLGDGFYQGTWFGYPLWGSVYAPIAEAVVFTTALWFITLWMYRRKIFLKI